MKLSSFYRYVLGFGIKEDKDTTNIYLEKDGPLFLLFRRSDFEKIVNKKLKYVSNING